MDYNSAESMSYLDEAEYFGVVVTEKPKGKKGIIVKARKYIVIFVFKLKVFSKRLEK